jgi:threonine synthase
VSLLATGQAAETLPPKELGLECASCGLEAEGLTTKCEECGGMIETRYALPVRWEPRGEGFFGRFWPLLPIVDAEHVGRDIELGSPTVRAEGIQGVLGGPELWLKNETALPTGTTKDRVSIVVFPYLRQFGVREFVVSSTGNTSTAIARTAQYYPDMHVHIFIGQDFIYRLRHIESPNVTIHVVDGNFVQAGKVAQAFAEQHALHWEAGFFNPSRRDGLKTAFVEAALDMKRPPATYVQAVSSGMGVVGTAKGARELAPYGFEPATPRLLCVQQVTCSPMVNAWERGSATIGPEDKVADPIGIAKAILRGDPSGAYPVLRRLVVDSGGTFVKVDEREIRHAQQLLFEHESIWACEAAACALAGYAKLLERGEIGDDDGPVLVNVTGGPRKRRVWSA